jgi:hypothetical protein
MRLVGDTNFSPNAGKSGKNAGPTLNLTAFVEIKRTKPFRVRWQELRNTLWEFSLKSQLRRKWNLTRAEGRRAKEGQGGRA